MSVTTRVADKAGVIGTLVGSFGCAACFPAAASIGAAVGLGFLGQWEGVLVRLVIPIFAIVALLASLIGWFSHRRWHRALAGCIGPVMALVGAFGLMGIFGITQGFLAANIARGTFYAGLIVMVLVALWDLVRPASPYCRPATTERRANGARRQMTRAGDQHGRSNRTDATHEDGAPRVNGTRETDPGAPTLRLDSTISCPSCGAATRVRMPTDACQFFWECPACGALLRPKAGDCCVFCSWADVPCPPTQMRHNRSE